MLSENVYDVTPTYITEFERAMTSFTFFKNALVKHYAFLKRNNKSVIHWDNVLKRKIYVLNHLVVCSTVDGALII